MGKNLPPREPDSLSGRSTRTRPALPVSHDWRDRLSTELSKARRLFILGVGNRRKADDGAGSRCAGLLKLELRKGALENIQVLDAGEVPENATGLIRRFGPTHVLIVDAAVSGHEPGRVFVVDRRRIPRDDLSTHRIPLIHLVRYLEQSVRCRVIVVGIEPRVIAWNQPMSPPVKAAAAELARVLFRIWAAASP
jgi:hydrogenase 3 maturation protease